MTIVSEKNVSTALTYMAEDPHPVALARKDLTDAENEYESIRAKVYLEQSGTVAEREAATLLDRRVSVAKEAVAEAAFGVDRHRARLRAAEMLIDIFRTENANARAAERVR
jgi:hypothetical protein